MEKDYDLDLRSPSRSAIRTASEIVYILFRIQVKRFDLNCFPVIFRPSSGFIYVEPSGSSRETFKLFLNLVTILNKYMGSIWSYERRKELILVSSDKSEYDVMSNASILMGAT